MKARRGSIKFDANDWKKAPFDRWSLEGLPLEPPVGHVGAVGDDSPHGSPRLTVIDYLRLGMSAPGPLTIARAAVASLTACHARGASGRSASGRGDAG